MRNNSFVLLILVIILWSCEKDGSTVNKGDIYVTVYSNSGNSYVPIKGADVFTMPATQQAITDEYGTVLLKNLIPGSYEVYANLNDFGSGKTVVRVSGDSLKRVTIYIERGVTTGFTPEIELILPSVPANFTFNEKIVFSFVVKDNDSQPNDINVILSSNLDGKLLETHPDATNNIKFETSSLSRGNHIITITATDKDKYSATKTIEVSTMAPGSIILESATADSGTVQLQWQKYTLPDFKRYEVLRSLSKDIEGQVIASFNSGDSLKYSDKLPPFTSEVYYYIRVSNTEEQTRNSNKIKVTEPAGKIYYYTITDAVHHPSEPIVYIVDNASLKLRAINYKTQTLINSISLDETVGKIDIGDNGYGLEIYVPNNSGYIKVYNASTLNLVTSINTGLATKCVVSNGHGYIVASLVPSPWWEQPVRTYSRTTGINISGNMGTVFEANRLRFIPNTDNIIAISTSVSPVDMDFFQLDNTGKIISNNDDSYHGDHPLDPNIFKISGNGDFVITGNTGAVYSATSSMIYKGMVDRGALYFSDFAFSKDGNTIYAGTSNRASIQIIKYPELTRNNEILLKGYPKFLFYYNGEIISISKTDLNNDNTYAFESIKVE
jgi:hypothetical protein